MIALVKLSSVEEGKPNLPGIPWEEYLPREGCLTSKEARKLRIGRTTYSDALIVIDKQEYDAGVYSILLNDGSRITASFNGDRLEVTVWGKGVKEIKEVSRET